MRVAILCSGPSLSRFAPFTADVILAVNSAGRLYQHDWYVAIDRCALTPLWEGLIRPRVGVVTHPAWFKKIDNRIRKEAYPISRLTHYSWPNAVAFALKLGATEVDCYGVDWKDCLDCAGGGGTRNKQRWIKEAAALRTVITDKVRIHGDISDVWRYEIFRDVCRST